MFDRDGAAMRIDDALYDRKPEAGAARLAAVATPEALKDHFAFGVGDALAVVEHAHGSIFVELDFDRCTLGRVVDRIFNEISDGTVQHFRIAIDPDRTARSAKRKKRDTREFYPFEKFKRHSEYA